MKVLILSKRPGLIKYVKPQRSRVGILYNSLCRYKAITKCISRTRTHKDQLLSQQQPMCSRVISGDRS